MYAYACNKRYSYRRKMRYVTQNSARKSNISIKQMFKLLFLVANVRSQPSTTLIDGLVDDAVLLFSHDGD